MSDSPVVYTKELGRILALPRRDWANQEGLRVLADQLKQVYGQPRGTQHLRPIQTAAILDAYNVRGLFGPIPVGAGKTLASFLIPVVIEAKRPLLLVPAKLKAKTGREYGAYRQHWKILPIRTESYESLGRADNADVIERYKPDLIIADEAHKLKNRDAAVTKRVERYVEANPATVVVAMSGSFTNRSIREYAHIVHWCLGDHGFLPRGDDELGTWAAVLDADKNRIPSPPGALALLTGDHTAKVPTVYNPFEIEGWVAKTRQGYFRRMVETPGVIATTEAVVDIPMKIRAVEPPGIRDSKPIADAFAQLRELWETPDGHPFAEAYDLWRHARELVCGFFYRWNPRPPDDWLEARKAWCKFVRSTLNYGPPGYDSMLQVARGCQTHVLEDGTEVPPKLDPRAYEDWVAVRDTFKPQTEPVWIDDSALKYAGNWLKTRRGICWVEHVAFGEKLEEMTGIPYYGRGGMSARGGYIEAERGPLIASIRSNCEGRNLQTAHSRNLVVSNPCNATMWEQLMGRTHRPGQLDDVVEFDIVLACAEQLNGLLGAIREAEYVQATQGARQKLLLADVQGLDDLEYDAVRSPSLLWTPA